MEFIKFTVDGDKEFLLCANKIESIQDIEGVYSITMDSGDSFVVNETLEEILAMFPKCPF